MISFSWSDKPSQIQLKQLYALFLEAFLPQGHSNKEKLTHYFNEKIIPRLGKGHLIHLCFDHANVIIGFALFEKWNEGCYYLAEMAILPEYQGQNIGKKCLFSIFEKDSGCQRIILVTEIENNQAQGFYKTVGFHRSSFQHPDYPTGFVGYEYLKNQPN